jgi:GNAT superfamily N-acetyltransferase
MLEVKPLREEEWALLKSVRLQALAESPEAFSTTLLRAQSWSDEEWQERARRFAVGTREVAYLAYMDGRPCGMVTCYLSEETSLPASSLAALWVHPEVRQKGVGAALVDAALQWSKRYGVTTVEARVTEQNSKAIAFYERLGFERTDPPALTDPASAPTEVSLLRTLPPDSETT